MSNEGELNKYLATELEKLRRIENSYPSSPSALKDALNYRLWQITPQSEPKQEERA